MKVTSDSLVLVFFVKNWKSRNTGAVYCFAFIVKKESNIGGDDLVPVSNHRWRCCETRFFE